MEAPAERTTPTTETARSLTVPESVAGRIDLAVLVARSAGVHVRQPSTS